VIILVVFGGVQGNGKGEFNSPMGIVIRGSEIYIGEYSNHRITVLDVNSGKFVRHIGQYGAEDGQFKVPHSIVMISHDELLVVDAENHRFQVFQ